VSSLLPEKGRGGAIFGSLILCDVVPVLGLVGPGPRQAGTGVAIVGNMVMGEEVRVGGMCIVGARDKRRRWRWK
jgi:hypothetical protein